MATFTPQGGAVNFNSGTVKYSGAATLDDTALSTLLGGTQTLSTGRKLAVVGAAGLTGTVNVGGGTLITGTFNTNGALNVTSGNVTVANALTVNNGEHRHHSGGIVTAGSYANAAGGRITIDGLTSRLASVGTLTNDGLITGNGTVTAALANGGPTAKCGHSGPAASSSRAANTNNGAVNLNGAAVEFSQKLVNSSTGFITGRGTLTAKGGNTDTISNNGVVAFSGGSTDVHGDVQNNPGGVSSLRRRGPTFYDDVVHNGAEIRTFAGSRTVFFGGQSGAGRFTGTGTVEYIATCGPATARPGTYGGTVLLNPSAKLVAELGGTHRHGRPHRRRRHAQPGRRPAGDRGINGFNAAAGNSFDLFDGAMAGTFNSVTLPTLALGLGWDTSQLYSAGLISVQLVPVPEPRPCWPWPSLAAGAARKFRRRDARHS